MYFILNIHDTRDLLDVAMQMGPLKYNASLIELAAKFIKPTLKEQRQRNNMKNRMSQQQKSYSV